MNDQTSRLPTGTAYAWYMYTVIIYYNYMWKVLGQGSRKMLSLAVSLTALAYVGVEPPGTRRRQGPRMAEGGPPPIHWQTGRVTANAALSRGTNMLTITADENLSYEPGHILGLEITHPETGEALKGPYTVTRCVDGNAFDIIYRIIPDGRKTPFMSELNIGATVRFGGKFGTPIAQGISSPCDRVIGIATGAGVGPLLGYAEEVLSSEDGPSLEIYAGFRDLADVCCGAELDALAKSHPARFRWTPCISRPMACTAIMQAPLAAERLSGRVTSAVPPVLQTTACTHFHLIGNGAFVKDFQQGLLQGGVAEEAITTETYFNGKVEPNADVVGFIAAIIQGLASAPPMANI